jgi:transposase InsO family protein
MTFLNPIRMTAPYVVFALWMRMATHCTMHAAPLCERTAPSGEIKRRPHGTACDRMTRVAGGRLAARSVAPTATCGYCRRALVPHRTTLFRSLAHTRAVLEAWRADHNTDRPHSRLGWMSPAIYASARRSAALPSPDGSAPRTASITAQPGITDRQTPIVAG